jgi:hypothetical protein
MDTGNSSSTIPNMDSGFPVDFSLTRTPASTSWPWFTGARLTGNKYLLTYDTNAEQTASDWVWDNNEGWMKGGNGNTVQSWMFKRHAGFDVVTYSGNGVAKAAGGHQVPHNLSKSPEMLWVKKRSDTANWAVYHKGLNGGTNPEQYFLKLDSDEAETNSNAPEHWADTAPTATHFTLGSTNRTNNSNGTYIAMLFASVDGISKVGYYDGDGSTNGSNAITVGFQPRFLIIKRTDATGDWNQFDTVRGLGSGVNTMSLNLNTNGGQTNQGSGKIGLSSTAFIPGSGGEAGWNGNNEKYIYYAHA